MSTVDFDKKKKQNELIAAKKAFAQKFPTLDRMYFIYSALTNAPHVSWQPKMKMNQAFLFTDEKKAKDVAKRLNDDKRPVMVVKIEKENLLNRVGDLIAYGVSLAIIQDGEKVMPFLLTELVKRQDFSNLPEEKRPVENPLLSISLLFYAQEARRVKEARDEKLIRELDHAMVVQMVQGKYLLPFEAREDKKIGILTVTNKKSGVILLPIFTDGVEYKKFRNEKEFRVLPTNFEKLCDFPLPEGAKGFVINPAGVNIPVTQDFIRKVVEQKKAAQKAAAEKKETEKDTDKKED